MTISGRLISPVRFAAVPLPQTGGRTPARLECPESEIRRHFPGIPSGGVAPPANIPDILGRRALPDGRRAPENLSPNFGLGTLAPARTYPRRAMATITHRLS